MLQFTRNKPSVETIPLVGATPAAASAPVLSAAEQKLEAIPKHIAIIMDGNGRWAKNKGLLRIQGHKAGADSVQDVVKAAGELGVKYLTLYAFSVENWKRPSSEVIALMSLLESFLRDELGQLMKNNIRLEAIGRLSDLPNAAREQLEHCIHATRHNDGLHLILALSYSGRVEIVEAVRAIARQIESGQLESSQIDEKVIQHNLYTRRFPDPDLLIRTSGEMRVSNFLLWQISYAEIYVTPTLWPDFRRDHFVEALADYGRRQRRFGAV